jgi:hypothetical protein
MRLWTIHPRYLDAKGLVAAWREALLAQAVLAGRTRGYRHHPQLERFRLHPRPRSAIATYLRPILAEAASRGYRFDASRIAPASTAVTIEETEGQLLFEWRHLLAKLAARDPAAWERLRAVAAPDPHPLFAIVAGPRRPWEKS